MPAKRCINCGLINPKTAVRCDCGFSFADGSMGAALALPETHQQRESRRSRAIGYSALSLVLLAVMRVVVKALLLRH